jgi:uroporphyrinogen decarboxylase
MSMFATFGTADSIERKPSTLAKLDRVNKTFRHEEADRVPISDFFWGGFRDQWRRDLGLPADADPYYHYDLDFIVTVPNMDPHIRTFETIREDAEEVVVKTGFETTIRKRFDLPMPEQVSWETDTIEKLEAFEFDDPWDRRRYFEAGDNQIAGVGDGFERNSPPWVETVKSLYADFPVYGSITESSEICTRLLGQLNTMMWIGEEPERFGEQLLRIGEFSVEVAKAQIAAADGLLDGLVIWGDVAYRKGLFMGPEYWRRYYKPTVAKIIEVAHGAGLPVMYHGCGNANAIFEDMIEIGLDGYNPLEAKADLDVVALRERLGHRLAFCGNSDIRVWERGDPDEVRREVLHRLRAAEGGGYIFMSDHSVASDVSGHTYDSIVKLVREYGTYPLRLPEE